MIYRLLSAIGAVAHIGDATLNRISAARMVRRQTAPLLAIVALAACALTGVFALQAGGRTMHVYDVGQLTGNADAKPGDLVQVTGYLSTEYTRFHDFDGATTFYDYFLLDGADDPKSAIVVRSTMAPGLMLDLYWGDNYRQVTGTLREPVSVQVSVKNAKLGSVKVVTKYVLSDGDTPPPATPLYAASVVTGLFGLLCLAGWLSGYVVFRPGRAGAYTEPMAEKWVGTRVTGVLAVNNSTTRAREMWADLLASATGESPEALRAAVRPVGRTVHSRTRFADSRHRGPTGVPHLDRPRRPHDAPDPQPNPRGRSRDRISVRRGQARDQDLRRAPATDAVFRRRRSPGFGLPSDADLRRSCRDARRQAGGAPAARPGRVARRFGAAGRHVAARVRIVSRTPDRLREEGAPPPTLNAKSPAPEQVDKPMPATSPNQPPAGPVRTREERLLLLRPLLEKRILVLDGATGTLVQRYSLTEADFRGERFRDHPRDLRGDADVLTLTRPDVVRAVHDAYLAAGADIITTDTFTATRIAQADYGLEDAVYEMHVEAARIARAAADAAEARDPGRPRFVAGSLGPTNKSASISPDVSDPAARNVTFEELVEAYAEAARGLLLGGADMLMVETIFDVLNAKAAIFAIEQVFEELGVRVPLWISGTITDASGRTLSGHTVEAFWNAVRHARPLIVGLNCALGARQLREHVEELSGLADTFVAAHPNAGLPNEFGGVRRDARGDGRGPARVRRRGDRQRHRRMLRHGTGARGRVRGRGSRPAGRGSCRFGRRLSVSPASRRMNVGAGSLFLNIGERTNVAGSRAFAKRIIDDDFDGALEIARGRWTAARRRSTSTWTRRCSIRKRR